MKQQVIFRKQKLTWTIINKKCSACGNHLRKEVGGTKISCSYVKCKYKHRYRGE